ncbi:hypothetical protein ACFOHS_08425 [Jhaorihella thermophila]
MATHEAEDRHGEALRAALEDDGRQVELRRIPSGRSEAELRDQFRILRDTLIEDTETPLTIDITHGFRAQPFLRPQALRCFRHLADCPSRPGSSMAPSRRRTETPRRSGSCRRCST